MSIVCSELSFSWPDGTPVLSGLNAVFGPGRTRLIGLNGSGKSTLLRLMGGELAPVSGAVTVTGDVGYLPQDLTLDTGQTVASLLGIAAARDAIAAIENGEVSEAAFAAVGDDWDVEERARGWLSRLGLDHLGLDDQVAALSGGETMMTALAALFLRGPAVILLDEPTNNLDLEARERLYAAVAGWAGVMVIVSHDRELLGLVDQIAELSDAALHLYGGNLAAYEDQRAAEQAAAERAVTAAAAGEEPPPLGELVVRGPERIALTGPNGAGKTTLLRAVTGLAALRGVAVRRHGAFGYLPQRLDILDDSLTVAANVRAAAPAASVNEVRAGLARFLSPRRCRAIGARWSSRATTSRSCARSGSRAGSG